MAAVSFTKEMRLNEKETKSLLAFLSKNSKCNFKVTPHEPKNVSDKTIEKMVRRVTQ